MNIGQLQSLIGLCIGVISFLSGAILWYKGSIEKRYAAQRDFGHLKNNQETISRVLNEVCEQIDELSRSQSEDVKENSKANQQLNDMNRTMLEMKMMITAMQNRFEIISAKIDSSTGAWRREP